VVGYSVHMNNVHQRIRWADLELRSSWGASSAYGGFSSRPSSSSSLTSESKTAAGRPPPLRTSVYHGHHNTQWRALCFVA
ncbi:hypothetical protein AVEN_5187-1, partial [Araneus ventricosus]